MSSIVVSGPHTVSQLLIQAARLSDSGIYTCHLHYTLRPDRNTKLRNNINVQVLQGEADFKPWQNMFNCWSPPSKIQSNIVRLYYLFTTASHGASNPRRNLANLEFFLPPNLRLYRWEQETNVPRVLSVPDLKLWTWQTCGKSISITFRTGSNQQTFENLNCIQIHMWNPWKYFSWWGLLIIRGESDRRTVVLILYSVSSNSGCEVIQKYF